MPDGRGSDVILEENDAVIAEIKKRLDAKTRELEEAGAKWDALYDQWHSSPNSTTLDKIDKIKARVRASDAGA